MKFSIPVMVIALATAAPAWAAPAEPGQENTACTAESPGGDFIQFSCPLPARSGAQRWRFKAEFSGGHDDTSASMTVTLDGSPFTCAAGSKTKLFGEDGKVSLVCHIRVTSPSTTRQVIGVALLWSHAQYVRTELVAE